jgi:DNA invertase Pin-like site-specific DNA recombinase
MANKLSLSPVERNTALCYIRKSWTFHVKEEDEIEAEADKTDNKRKGKYETDNATEQISPERQRAHIQAICDANGWTAEWYKDTEKHKSGMHEKNRPGWLALKSRMRDPDVVAIVANDLARLHRKGWRIGDLLDFVDEHGIKLVIADPRRQIDFSTPYGRMFAQLSAIFDEWYALDISERRKADIAHRKSEGKTVGLPPFGTRRNKDGYLVATQEGA